MKKILISFSIALLVSCSAKVRPISQADADRGASKFGGTTLASLNEGKNLYSQNCNKCHGLKAPTSRNEEEWNKIVPRMVKKVNKKAGSEELNSQEEELILHYLVTMSTAPKN